MNYFGAMRALLISVLVVGTTLTAAPARAWLYPEHRGITLLAIEGLNAEQRSAFEALWREARMGREERLCERAGALDQGREPECIDWAAWPAIAGDHSCSADDMSTIVLESDWILKVADVAARLDHELAEAKTRAGRINALRDADVLLQRTDPDYVSRAESNLAHFLLWADRAEESGVEYAIRSFQPGTNLNAIGIYALFHLSALEKATLLASGALASEERGAVARSALADEAFALHFIQDTFAAGHVAGTWGDSAVRKGTHDYYNEAGLRTELWNGAPVVLTGDAYLRTQDAELAARAVRASLAQVVDVASGRRGGIGLVLAPQHLRLPERFDVCTSSAMPARRTEGDLAPYFDPVLKQTPAPQLGPGLGELPRFRTELGPFIGLAAGGGSRTVSGGFSPQQTEPGAIGSLMAELRLGFGLDGILNEAGDGLVFLGLGVHIDSPSSNRILDDGDDLRDFGAITSALPSRSALSLRLRMPFWLIPGDLILASPMLAFAPRLYTDMASIAGNGGLIPWQLGIATPIGRFQFVAGREVNLTLYGLFEGDDRFILLGPDNPEDTVLVSLRTVKLDFPLLEYRPFRTFSQDQTAGIVAQLHAGFEQPRRLELVTGARASAPEVRTIWFAGLTILFDWRAYL